MARQDGRERAVAMARSLLHQFGMERAAEVDIYDIARRLGVTIVGAPLAGALAQLVVYGSSARILLSHRLNGLARRRIAIAHELGHYVLGHPSPAAAELGRGRGDPADVGQHGFCDIECEADWFASALLVPASMVDALCQGRDLDLDLCADLARVAGVPIEFAATRLAERGGARGAAVLAAALDIRSVALPD